MKPLRQKRLQTVAVPEISEQMLIEEMQSKPQSFLNALIINLHGELLPLPPIRNYSDAAKDLEAKTKRVILT